MLHVIWVSRNLDGVVCNKWTVTVLHVVWVSRNLAGVVCNKWTVTVLCGMSCTLLYMAALWCAINGVVVVSCGPVLTRTLEILMQCVCVCV